MNQPEPAVPDQPQATLPDRKLDLKIVLRIGWSMLRRRFLVLALSFIAALVIGVLGSEPLTERVWKATGVLLYTPPTIPRDVESIRDSVSLSNVSGLAKSRPVLYRVKDELGLSFPVALFEKTLTAETSRNTSTIFFALEWGNRQEAMDILDKLLSVYPEYVTKVRQQIAQSMLTELERQITTTKARLEGARLRHRDFTRSHKIVDLKQDLVLLQTKLLGLETTLDQSKRNESSYKRQIEMLQTHIMSIRAEEIADAEREKEFEAANETLADNRRRQSRLRELIAEERRVVEIKAQIEVKRREYERTKKLADRQLIPISRLERVRGDLESLIAKITQNKEIVEWQNELLDLDKLVVPKNQNSKKGSPIIQQILFRKLESELNIAQEQAEQLALERTMQLTKTQVATFQQLRNDLAELEDDVESISIERQGLEAKASVLRQLATQGPSEFSMVTPVSTGEFPVKSNRKRMFACVVLAVLFLVFSTIAAHDVLKHGIIPPQVQVELMGLPMIGHVEPTSRCEEPEEQEAAAEEDGESKIEVTREEFAPDEPFEYSESVRLLALRLRQYLPDAGHICLLSSLEDPERFSDLIEQLASCLGKRDERVLILDTRELLDGIGPFGELIDAEVVADQFCESQDVETGVLPGLRDWLAFRCDDLSDVVLPSKLMAVDCVLPGRISSIESLATIRMSELMEYIRERYTFTLMVGPEVSRMTEIQILAAHSDGVAIVFDPRSRVDGTTSESIRSLMGTGAPLIGAVSL